MAISESVIATFLSMIWQLWSLLGEFPICFREPELVSNLFLQQNTDMKRQEARAWCPVLGGTLTPQGGLLYLVSSPPFLMNPGLFLFYFCSRIQILRDEKHASTGSCVVPNSCWNSDTTGGHLYVVSSPLFFMGMGLFLIYSWSRPQVSRVEGHVLTGSHIVPNSCWPPFLGMGLFLIYLCSRIRIWRDERHMLTGYHVMPNSWWNSDTTLGGAIFTWRVLHHVSWSWTCF